MSISNTNISETSISSRGTISTANAVSFPAHVQGANLGEYIELFDIDATNIGGTFTYITPNTNGGNKVVWRGNEYIPCPIEGEGFEINKQAAPPRPTIRVSNINKLLLASVISLGDLVGAKVTRWRTFRQFLDGEINADPDAHMAKEIYYIYQKTTHNRSEIAWTLRSNMDFENLQLPGRQILRDKGFPGVARIRVR